MRLALAALLTTLPVHVGGADATCGSVPYTSDHVYVPTTGVGLTVSILCANAGNVGLNPLALGEICTSGWVCAAATGCTLYTDGEVGRCMQADAALCCYNPAFTAREAANPAVQGSAPDIGVTPFATGAFTAAFDPGYGATYLFPITALDTSMLADGFQTGLATQKLVTECGAAFPGQPENCYDADTGAACAGFQPSMYGDASQCTALTDSNDNCEYTPLKSNSLYHVAGIVSDYGLNSAPLQGKSATLWHQFKALTTDGHICPTRS